MSSQRKIMKDLRKVYNDQDNFNDLVCLVPEVIKHYTFLDKNYQIRTLLNNLINSDNLTKLQLNSSNHLENKIELELPKYLELLKKQNRFGSGLELLSSFRDQSQKLGSIACQILEDYSLLEDHMQKDLFKGLIELNIFIGADGGINCLEIGHNVFSIYLEDQVKKIILDKANPDSGKELITNLGMSSYFLRHDLDKVRNNLDNVLTILNYCFSISEVNQFVKIHDKRSALFDEEPSSFLKEFVTTLTSRDRFKKALSLYEINSWHFEILNYVNKDPYYSELKPKVIEQYLGHFQVYISDTELTRSLNCKDINRIMNIYNLSYNLLNRNFIVGFKESDFKDKFAKCFASGIEEATSQADNISDKKNLMTEFLLNTYSLIKKNPDRLFSYFQLSVGGEL